MRQGSDRGAPKLACHADTGFLSSLIADGSTVLVGGFGEPGTPFFLLDGLARSGTKDLTVIKNDANEPAVGVGQLLRAGALRRLVTSHIGLNPEMVDAMNSEEVAVDFHPQGILAEKIRCGGVGLPGFLSDVGVGLLPLTGSHGMALRAEIDWEGERYLLEPAIRAQIALLHAHTADRYGNLTYRKSARNFNPLMAMAAENVIVEVERLLDEPLDPECVHTPGCFVDHLVVIPPGFEVATKAQAMRRESSDG